MIAFELCPNCRRHGHLVVNGEQLPEVFAQNEAEQQLLRLQANGVITGNDVTQAFIAVQTSGLPETVEQAIDELLESPAGVLMILGMTLGLAGQPTSAMMRRRHDGRHAAG